MLCFQHPFGTADIRIQRAREEMGFPGRWLFDLGHPLQNLLPGSGKGGLFWLVLKSLNQFFQPLYFLLLLAVSFFLQGQIFGALFFIGRIISRIADQFQMVEFVDGIRGPVQEEPVVGDDDGRMWILS